jgi:two-component system, cell cycle sensor histidine kinase and response regulator CckA
MTGAKAAGMTKGRRAAGRIILYVGAIAVALGGAAILPSWGAWPRYIASVAIAIVVVAALEVVERRIRDASNTTFRELAEAIDEVFWLRSADCRKMYYVSPAWERLTGRTRAGLYADPASLRDAVHPDDIMRVNEALADPTRPVSLDYRMVHRDGSIRVMALTTFPLADRDGVVRRVAGSARDVTEHHRLSEQLRQTQKLESLGLLAGGIAHDFNNLLSVINANNSLLGESVTTSDDHELVDEIDGAVKRATSLTRQLLAFSRKQVTRPIVVDVNAAIADIHKMLHRMVGDDVAIETSLEPELAPVRIDPGHLVQIVMNLAVNARDAMNRGGKLVLATRNLAGQVMLSVADTGCGMPADVMAHVFEPFFTTKGNRGTGLGLSVVHGIVTDARGRIEVHSEVGIGTTFEIYLPAVADSLALADAAPVAATRGAETIIFVDDDHYVRMTAARALRSKGYTVLEAPDADAALKLLRECGDQVSLLVTDIVMPGMNGRELAETARRSYPKLRVLYSTGYTDDAVAKHGIDRAEVAVIEKPFRNQALAGRVREILDAA